LLEKARQVGEVVIITNAMTGWVEQSASEHVPELVPLLRQVPIVSARGDHGKDFPADMARWKEQAFLALQKRLSPTVPLNLISLGDSPWDMDAAHSLGERFEEAWVKTVKLANEPTPEQLRKELELIGCRFDKILNCERSMRVTLDRRVA
jgi:hypothetical protein